MQQLGTERKIPVIQFKRLRINQRGDLRKFTIFTPHKNHQIIYPLYTVFAHNILATYYTLSPKTSVWHICILYVHSFFPSKMSVYVNSVSSLNSFLNMYEFMNEQIRSGFSA